MYLTFTFWNQQGKENIHWLVVDSIEGDGLLQGKKDGGKGVTIGDTTMGNGDGAANAGAAHLLAGEQALEELLFIQSETLGGEFTDELDGPLFTRARDRTFGAVPAEKVLNQHHYLLFSFSLCLMS